jgi:hypothetical protein
MSRHKPDEMPTTSRYISAASRFRVGLGGTRFRRAGDTDPAWQQ